MKNTSKENIVKVMVNAGFNTVNAEKMVNTHYDYVQRVYEGQNLNAKQISKIISTLSM